MGPIYFIYFIGTGCGEPQALVRALAHFSTHIVDAGIYHFLTLGATPHLVEALANKFHFESFFINSGVRKTIWEGQGDYIPIFLSEIPKQIETGRIPVDVALIQVSPPNENGMCCYGPSVEITKLKILTFSIIVGIILHQKAIDLHKSTQDE